MHQFIDVPDSPGVMYFEIAFFTPHIFRVKFAGRDEKLRGLTDEPAFPPPEARMLIGKRREVPVKVEDTEYSIQLSSGAVDIHVQRKPFQIRASRQGETFPFWKQRLADIFTSDVIPCSITQHQSRTATFEAFTLSPSEALYGLGERFNSVSRLGRPVDFRQPRRHRHEQHALLHQRAILPQHGWLRLLRQCHRTHRVKHGHVRAGHGRLLHRGAAHGLFRHLWPNAQGDTDHIHTRPDWDITTPTDLDVRLWLSRNSYPSWSVVDEVAAQAKTHRIPL
jgi:hypothetical protein